MRLLPVAFLLLAATTASAHEERIRTDPREMAEGAELVLRGRVVQVEADRGTRGPRWVSVVIERALRGDPGAEAITFRAPPEHGPGWLVGENALFFLRRFDGRWVPTAIAAESPKAGPDGGAGLDGRWQQAAGEEEAALAAGEEEAALAAGEGLSFPALLAGALCFLGLIGLGRWRARNLALPK
ncbi:hypothetical protein [Vulgatibacter sp.]|uniref:hypothetical protein n=1 Tax=Vulgatibacter sp. TaxID=1971226 RepID=UPI003564284B